MSTEIEAIKATIVKVANDANLYGQRGLPDTCRDMRIAVVEIARAVDPDLSWLPAYQRPPEHEDDADERQS